MAPPQHLESVVRTAPVLCLRRMGSAVALFLAVMRGLSAEDSISDRFSALEIVHLEHNRPKLLISSVSSFGRLCSRWTISRAENLSEMESSAESPRITARKRATAEPIRLRHNTGAVRTTDSRCCGGAITW